MNVKALFFMLFNLLVIGLLLVYILNPGGSVEFSFNYDRSDNFSLENNSVKMQFHENMRFPNDKISYKISDNCSLKKRNAMKEAFDTIENETIILFYETQKNPEIIIYCQNRQVVENGMFIAGEGGPTNITDTNQFKVIFNGEILLIRDSNCPTPNVEIHELLHVMGFEHSENDNNIMYPVSKCKQTIGPEIPQLINEIYSFQTLPDLKIEQASGEINGRALSLSFLIRNEGLKSAGSAKIKIFSEDDIIKEIDLEPLGIGHGVKMELANIWISKIKIEELGVLVEADFDELSTDNNKVLLSKKI